MKVDLKDVRKTVSKGKGVLNYIFARLLKRYDTLLLEKKELALRRKEVSGFDMKESSDNVTKFLVAQTELSRIQG